MILLKSNFLINFNELKIRSIYYINSYLITFIICFEFKVELFYLISNIFLTNAPKGFIFINLFEPILIYIKLCLVFSFLFTLPIFIYIYSFFIFKCFYKFYTMYYYFLFSLIYNSFVILNTVFSYIFLPFLFSFLLSFQRQEINQSLPLLLQATLEQYFNFFTYYILIYFVIIIIPYIFLLLLLNGIINKKYFLNQLFRKYLYIIIIILFLLLSPPDLLLQVLLFPFIILILEIHLYIISILFVIYLTF